MIPTEFPEQTVVYAKDQPEYIPLPVYKKSNCPHGQIICRWKLSWKERLQILLTGVLWHSILTFNRPLQPQQLTTSKPEMK